MRIPSSVATLVIAGYLCDCCHGQRVQTDNILVDTVWSVEDSPIVEIPQDIFVEEQGSLTITEGVQVDFTGPYTIFVQGDVFLNGTEANPITIRNGFKAFSILELQGNGPQVEFEARHTLFANHTGGAIMREWLTTTAPMITVSDCQFQNNEYAIRSYLVQLANSDIQGGRVGLSLHSSTVSNTQIDGMAEICLFASSESTVTNCTIANCGTIGAWMGGQISDTTIINADEGIVAATGGLGGIVQAQADYCVIRGARSVGLKYLDTVSNTVVLDSPGAIGAMVSSGEITGSIIAGSTIGVQTSNPNADSASVSITNSYICGNSEAQFDARNFVGSSSATSTVFGDTASNEDTLGENFFFALPYDNSANGFLQYDLLDTDAVLEPSIIEEEGIDLETICGVTSTSSPTETTQSPTASATTSQPSMDLALTSAPTETPIETSSPTIVSTSLSPTIQASQAPSIMTSSPTQPIETVAATTTESPTQITLMPTVATTTLMPTAAGTVSQAPSSGVPLTMSPTALMTVSQAPSSGVPLTMMPTEAASATPSTPPVVDLPVQKEAPPPKCGSIAGSAGRGGAAAQAKECVSGRRKKQRRLKGC